MILSEQCQKMLADAIRQMLHEVAGDDIEHIDGTPRRVVLAYADLLGGVHQDASAVLRTSCGRGSFPENNYNQMITVESIDFVSVCVHHLLPFYGQAHFAYLPDAAIVGLSKIPRMVDILARRPQVQERLTQQIVDVFYETVAPLGCGVMIRAWHGCVACRGVRKPNVRMRTVALRGYFLEKPEVKAEFLSGLNGK